MFHIKAEKHACEFDKLKSFYFGKVKVCRFLFIKIDREEIYFQNKFGILVH